MPATSGLRRKEIAVLSYISQHPRHDHRLIGAGIMAYCFMSDYELDTLCGKLVRWKLVEPEGHGYRITAQGMEALRSV